MKILLLIFALACHHMVVSSQVGGWEPVSLDQLTSDPNLESLLAWGVQNLTQQEVAAGNLPESTYQYEQVYSIYSQVVSGMNYQFDVDISNDQYWVLRATFVVYNQPWTNTTELSSYVYDVIQKPGGSGQEEFVIPSEEELVGGYSSVSTSDLDSDEQNALDYGVKFVTDQAVTEHLLPESEYHVIEIHSIYEQVVSGMNYRFDVSLENCAGLVARAVFIVYSQSWTNTLEATPESLDITNIPDEGLVGGDCTANNEEAYLLEEEEMNFENEEEGLEGGYTLLTPQEVASDPEIKDLQQFGANYVIDQGIKDQRIPNTTYQVSKVFSVEKQVVSGMNYRFDVELKACNGLTARAQYVVYEQEWSGTKEVTSSHLDITAAPNGPALAGCPSS